ncbi:MAG: class I SAM-dependent methyltransferase [Gammaproteobacteria bacterium]|nr:class I SAM-dependent methyltransferase [Gammaproteobacteria bacterium]
MPDWEKHYADIAVGDQTVASVLTENEHLLEWQGLALDYACGLAANGRWLAARGYEVIAWDMSRNAVEKLNQYSREKNIRLTAEVRDLENNPPTDEKFDVIVVSFFLHRQTLLNLYQALKPGGLLFYQTFLGEQKNGRGPSNSDFRLTQGELLRVYSDMENLFYREDEDQALFVGKK